MLSLAYTNVVTLWFATPNINNYRILSDLVNNNKRAKKTRN